MNDIKKVVIVCNEGMSSSVFVKKIKQAAAENSDELDVSCFGISEIKERAKDADLILLGPQVGYLRKDVEKYFPSTPVEVMDMLAFAMMDGNKVYNQVKKVLNLTK